MEITVRKKWDTPTSLDPIQNNAWAQFQVWRDPTPDETGDPSHNGWVKVVVNGVDTNTLNKDNDWEMTFEVEKGHTYHIIETAAQCGTAHTSNNDFTIAYSVNGVESEDSAISEQGTVEITNSYTQPYLELLKEWDTETNHSDFEIWLNIYRKCKIFMYKISGFYLYST